MITNNKEMTFYDVLKKCNIENDTFDSNTNTLNVELLHCINLTIEEFELLNIIETIEGKLIIESSSITNLSTFNYLEKVKSITITHMNILKIITGFNALESLETLIIDNNISLEFIYGFNYLFSHQLEMNGMLKIINNTKLENITFLKGLKKVNSSLYLHYNSLKSLEGLENLEFVNASLSLSSNQLVSLEALSSLKVVNGMFGVVNNKLETLHGLENLQSLKTVKWNGQLRTIALNSNSNLKDISALRNIKTANDIIMIVDLYDNYKKVPHNSSSFSKYKQIIYEKTINDTKYIASKSIEEQEYLKSFEDVNEYFTLSNKSMLGGNYSITECKFIIVNVDTSNPKFYWMNTKIHKYHYMFYKNILGNQIKMSIFDSISYSNENRKNIVGTLIYHEKPVVIDGKELFYSVNFWPSDSIKFNNIFKTFEIVKQRATFVKDKLFLHVVSDIQQQTINKQSKKFEKSNIVCVDSEILMGNIDFLPMNYGVSYGILRFATDTQNFSIKDIVVLNELPNHLSHVSGILTDLPQTPLSHINLLAKQNKIPNAYLKNASQKKELLLLKDQYVKLEVSSSNYKITKAKPRDIEKYFDKIRPKKELSPKSDLSIKTIESFKDLNNHNYTAYGTKSSNLGELHNIFDEQNLPNGFGIPFFFYDEFMKYNNFYEEIESLSKIYDANENVDFRDDLLTQFRIKVREADVPTWMENEFNKIIQNYSNNIKLRFRSSTNNEDLEDFSGAGLYDSYSYKNFTLPVSSTVKKVWASIWNFRAFEERRFYKVKHTKTMMGICVHPRYKDEKANGVAVTKNIFNERKKGFYINVQTGESLVTNPDKLSIPEEIVVVEAENKTDYVFQYIRYSNMTKDSKKVLKKKHLKQLISSLERLDSHFKNIYCIGEKEKFAMEIEFKITKDGVFHIKQARPWVEAI